MTRQKRLGLTKDVRSSILIEIMKETTTQRKATFYPKGRVE